MSTNKTLLSQSEIDALVSFLRTKEPIEDEVLEQSSIDRLVEILMDVNADEAPSEDTKRFYGNTVLSLEKDIAVQKEQCTLLYEKDEEGFVHIICANTATGVRYEITPECLSQSCIVESTGERWGYAVMPVLFDLVAQQLRVKYRPEEFSKVCKDYAKLVFGNPEAALPNVYLPTAARVLDNMGI